jgi:type IV pilus assembly protein PilQ
MEHPMIKCEQFSSRNRWTVKVLASMLGVMLSGAAMSANVTKVDVSESADKTEFLVEFDSPLGDNIRLFKVSNPDRQVIDFPEEVVSPNFQPKLSADSRVKSVQLLSAQGRGRLVFEMANAYQVSKVVDNPRLLRLVFSGPKPFKPTSELATNLSAEGQLKSVVMRTIDSPLSAAPVPVLTSWELVSADQENVLRLIFDQPEVRIDSVMRKDQLRLRIPMGKVAKDVNNALPDSADGVLKSVKLMPGDQVLTVSALLKDPKHQIRQNGNVVEVVFAKAVAQNFAPASSQAAVMPVMDTLPVRSPRGASGIVSSAPQTKMGSDVVSNEGRYVGRPISLDFSNADIRTVLQVFADFTKMNLVVSDSVQGRLTVHLKDVPWDQALEIVMRSKGLVSSRSGNVLLVSSQTDASSEQLEAATRRAKDDMEPLVSKTFVVSYQKTAEVVNLLKAKDSKLLSSRGTILSDERTSQIFIEDTPSRLERMVDIIRSVDKPVKQVMIEARVVLADTSVSKELGVRVRGASSPSTDFTDVGDAVGKQGFVDTGSAVSTTLAYTLLNANSTRLLSIQLKALETENRIHTVSNPRVITSNKELALIEQGTEIPYQIATSSGATATEFKEANLKLEVTPQISPDGSVLLDVNVSKDSIGVTTANGPAIDTRRVKTKVLVTDGGTVVLGGIFEENNNELDSRVPFLSDLPVLGGLFKSKTDSKRKAELLIFLTPVVLKDS